MKHHCKTSIEQFLTADNGKLIAASAVTIQVALIPGLGFNGAVDEGDREDFEFIATAEGMRELAAALITAADKTDALEAQTSQVPL